jgi:pimeloyl-ACP methyl ester carboxylesterase
VENIKKTDPAMRPTLGASSTPDNIKDEASIIKDIKVPVAVLHGEGDQLIRHTYFKRLEMPTLWRNKAQLIQNAGHCPQVENPKEFNRLLTEFLKEKIL